jgi:hypothetical protein
MRTPTRYTRIVRSEESEAEDDSSASCKVVVMHRYLYCATDHPSL